MHNEIFRLIEKSRENKLSHAFLIETNNQHQCLLEIKELIKNIVCPKIVDNNCSEECNLCFLIDNDTLPSIIVVEPLGASIKKHQLIELKEKLCTKPIYTSSNFYIIMDAFKMNVSSANTILKFLEEPTDQIIGFFLTNSAESIIDTIKSRCQLLKINYEENIHDYLKVNEDEYNSIMTVIKEYIELTENDIENGIIINKEIYQAINNRRLFELFFKLLLGIYEDQFNIIMDKKILIQDSSNFDIIRRNNSLKRIIAKIKLLDRYLNNLEFNPNLELYLDSFVIEMSDLSE